MKISEQAKGALKAFTIVIYLIMMFTWWGVTTQCERSIEKHIAKYEYKIKIARRDKRVKKFEHMIEIKEWYLEKAEWKKEWNDRYPD